MTNINVLSDRYATQEINDIFSEKGKNIMERELWIAVMKAQKDLGLDISSYDIEKYERAKNDVNLERITEIEMKTKHDVKAKIQAFVEASGAKEHLHKGMTSRDLTDNVEQMQVKKASKIILGKYVSVLKNMLDRANEYSSVYLTARTHHQAAQLTLLGRRFSMWAEELLLHLHNFEFFMDNYPLRGIKGPVGTQSDMLSLLGDKEKVNELEEKIAKYLGFEKILDSTGQVYPRSLDFVLTSNLAALSSACENFAKNIRLMAGYDLVTEGFKEGQVGSSAMPHKMNTRSSERICGASELVKMYNDGASRVMGDQWEEGDVSCSIGRRINIADSFYASDCVVETTLTVLREMGIYRKMIEAEINRYLPFLATTEFLMMAVKKGIGREKAHEIIKEYSVEEALSMRQKGKLPELAYKIAVSEELRLNEDEIYSMLNDREHFIGNARDQIEKVATKAQYFFDKYPKESQYIPRKIR